MTWKRYLYPTTGRLNEPSKSQRAAIARWRKKLVKRRRQRSLRR